MKLVLSFRNLGMKKMNGCKMATNKNSTKKKNQLNEFLVYNIFQTIDTIV